MYCPLIFLYPFIAGSKTNIAVNSLNTKRTSTLEKISESKIYAYAGMSEKWGLSHTNQENWVSHILIFVEKMRLIYLAVLKKGAIRHAHPYYAIYRKLPYHC